MTQLDETIRAECCLSRRFSSVRIVTLNARQYHWLTRYALWFLSAIVVSGAAVRLTGSGLGCSDWPNCEPGQLIPEADFHAWVEFGNRLVTGLVSLAVVLAVLGSLRRIPPARALTLWSWGLVIGVAAQIGLGAITVLTHLSPPIVMGHFLLSMVLIWNSVVLENLARPNGSSIGRTLVSPSLRYHAYLVVFMTALVIVAGTFVTATGPHGGDENVARLGFSFPSVARIHGCTVVALLAVSIMLRLRVRSDTNSHFLRRVNIFLLVALGQAAIGYVQYFTKLPIVLVACHIAGATVLWIMAIRLLLASNPQTVKAG